MPLSLLLTFGVLEGGLVQHQSRRAAQNQRAQMAQHISKDRRVDVQQLVKVWVCGLDVLPHGLHNLQAKRSRARMVSELGSSSQNVRVAVLFAAYLLHIICYIFASCS